jgi:hypothetical protein
MHHTQQCMREYKYNAMHFFLALDRGETSALWSSPFTCGTHWIGSWDGHNSYGRYTKKWKISALTN